MSGLFDNSTRDETFQVIAKDKQTRQALADLIKRGMSADYEHELLQRLSVLNRDWKQTQDETTAERSNRRKEMAKQIKRLSFLIKRDRDAQHYRIIDGKVFTTQPWEGGLSIGEILDTAAAAMASTHDPRMGRTTGKRPKRNKLEEYVRRNVCIDVLAHLPEQKKEPVAAIVKLCNVVLCAAKSKARVTPQNISDTIKSLKNSTK